MKTNIFFNFWNTYIGYFWLWFFPQPQPTSNQNYLTTAEKNEVANLRLEFFNKAFKKNAKNKLCRASGEKKYSDKHHHQVLSDWLN